PGGGAGRLLRRDARPSLRALHVLPHRPGAGASASSAEAGPRGRDRRRSAARAAARASAGARHAAPAGAVSVRALEPGNGAREARPPLALRLDRRPSVRRGARVAYRGRMKTLTVPKKLSFEQGGAFIAETRRDVEAYLASR